LATWSGFTIGLGHPWTLLSAGQRATHQFRSLWRVHPREFAGSG